MTTAHDLIRELQGDPALAAEVRAALLGDELLALPSSFERLAAAEARAAESFQGTQEALQTLTERVDQLTERVDRLTENVQALTERVDQLTREFYNFRREVAAEFARVHADTGELRGEFRDFRSEMGRMREMWGATEEDEAEDGLLDALEAMGYRIDGKPTHVKLDAHEFDVVVRATT
ncbi:MAG: hypothetical protein ACRDX8_11780, partial [Acidimicrobiales bacterium]